MANPDHPQASRESVQDVCFHFNQRVITVSIRRKNRGWPKSGGPFLVLPAICGTSLNPENFLNLKTFTSVWGYVKARHEPDVAIGTSGCGKLLSSASETLTYPGHRISPVSIDPRFAIAGRNGTLKSFLNCQSLEIETGFGGSIDFEQNTSLHIGVNK